MAAVGEQMALPGSRTNPNLSIARFLLKPGRKCEEAVKTFQPYAQVVAITGKSYRVEEAPVVTQEIKKSKKSNEPATAGVAS